MKLNPAKCTFAVKSGEFLGYLVTRRGIEANPKQIKAIIDLPQPKNAREVQRLTGRIAALNRFISRSTDKCLPFYQLLKTKGKFEWTEACHSAFNELKNYLSTPPILAKPKLGEILFLYIAVSESAVSGVLVKDDRGEQRPIFYIRKSLDDAETRYPTVEKVALAVVTSARKLRPPNQSGRLTKWAIELSEYDIEYRTRPAAKSQVLADFLIELPFGEAEPTPTDPSDDRWTLHVDGASSHLGSGIGIRLTSPTGEILEQSFRLRFQATNNVAEYEALIAGLKLANGMQIKRIRAFCDSQLVTNQFSGEYDTKSEPMAAYLGVVKILSKRFDEFELIKIPRGDNAPADALAALASTSDPDLRRIIPVESIDTPSISETHAETCLALHQPNEIRTTYRTMRSHRGCEPASGSDATDWRVEIRAYLADGDVPTDKWAKRRLKAKAAHYTLMKDHLLRWTASGALLLCIHGDDTERVMMETHEGAGGNHSGGRALALRIKKHGHYWPTMISDCEKFVAKCEKCQRHAPIIHQPTELLRAGIAPYPFMRWAMDIIGPLPTSRQKRYILVLTDYFTKWVEAESYANIKARDVQLFVWKYVICRHGLPYEIVIDNGSQFISLQFENFCARWRIKLSKSTPRYPKGNSQAEATNKTILDGLKKRLDAKKGAWADELDGT
ncbi:PREDICTED: uncharacterized protein LOC104759837 [Camelina sativa]|uniref:Uncharacterized protein LOC104759837 n=1 Tax=Camelina sativa TaxID=90675 RepID=A0ABM0X5H0_CAMSA|nr:PREDICTED: uncharacterized protein LOC104759837 [Camelina sativa]